MDFYEKRNFIINSFEDLNEKNMLLKCVENKSRDMIRMILGVRTKTYSPVELINRSAQIVVSKTQEGILENDDLKLQNYFSFIFSENSMANSDPLSVKTKVMVKGKTFKQRPKNSAAAKEAWDLVDQAKPNLV